jgi:hypothetical protein
LSKVSQKVLFVSRPTATQIKLHQKKAASSASLFSLRTSTASLARCPAGARGVAAHCATCPQRGITGVGGRAGAARLRGAVPASGGARSRGRTRLTLVPDLPVVCFWSG